MLVYLDTCAVQRPTDDRNQLRVRVEADAVLAVLAAVRSGAVQLLSSDVLRFEVDNRPFAEGKAVALAVLRLAARTVPTDAAVVTLAETFASAGIRALDALHLASAILGDADFFCTTDDRLLRRATRLDTRQARVVSPLALVAALDA